MQILMVSASDFYYVSRIERMRKQFFKCSEKFRQLETEYLEYLKLSNPSIAYLNVLASQVETVTQLMDEISKQITRIKLEFCN